MFTGIVQGRATVADVTDHQGVRALTLQFPPGALAGIAVGASVSVSGVCLTVVHHDGDRARFDCIDETLAVTTLGALAPAHAVNFERAATFGAEIGGHLLSGHIVGTATVVARTERGANLELVLRVPPDLVRYVLPKGYVALDGISLTIGRVDADTFSVHLIPETRRLTTIDARRPGDRVNLEVDAMTQAVVATVERVLAAREAG